MRGMPRAHPGPLVGDGWVGSGPCVHPNCSTPPPAPGPSPPNPWPTSWPTSTPPTCCWPCRCPPGGCRRRAPAPRRPGPGRPRRRRGAATHEPKSEAGSVTRIPLAAGGAAGSDACCWWASVMARPADLRDRRRGPRASRQGPRRPGDDGRRRRRAWRPVGASPRGWRSVATRPALGRRRRQAGDRAGRARSPSSAPTTSRPCGTRWCAPAPPCSPATSPSCPSNTKNPAWVAAQARTLAGRAGLEVQGLVRARAAGRGVRRPARRRCRLGDPAAARAARLRAGRRHRQDAAGRPGGQGNHLRHRWSRHQAGRRHARHEDRHERRRPSSSPCSRPAVSSRCR